ncbi:MAG: DUF3310 domain-containing protein [Fusobacteriaceae bacterium]
MVKKNKEPSISKHYSNNGIEVLDLLEDSGSLDGFARGNLIKYSYRAGKKANNEVDDIKKIIDYAMILAYANNIDLKTEELGLIITERGKWIAKRKKND